MGKRASKEAHAAYMRWYYAEKPEYRAQIAERSRKWKADNAAAHAAQRKDYDTSPRGRRLKLDNRLRSTYGITLEDYEALLVEQNFVCKLCGIEAWAAGGPGNRLNVDHDHKTGGIRGLLCSKCNVGLGAFGDDPDRLIKAAAYVRQNGGI